MDWIVRSRYGERKAIKVGFEGPKAVSRTKQSFRNECDINKIVAKAKKTGFLVDPMVAGTKRPFFGDFTAVGDYHTARLRILEAEKNFGKLPSKVRARFQNDPGKLLSFLSDPANDKEAEELKLIKPKQENTSPPPNPEPPKAA